jgi:hypothetical protein
MNNNNNNNFKKLIDLCSDVKSYDYDIDTLFYNMQVQGQYNDPEFEHTVIICYEKLLLRVGNHSFNILYDRYVIKALIQNEKYNMIRCCFTGRVQTSLPEIIHFVTEYSLKYFKIEILTLFINDLINVQKSDLLVFLKETILFYSSYHCCSNNDINVLVADMCPIYPSHDYFDNLLTGACAGNHSEIVKNIISDPKFNLYDRDIRKCIYTTTSFDIIKLLHGYKPDYGISMSFFSEILLVHKRFDIVYWIIDNNISIKKETRPTDYIGFITRLYWTIQTEILLYLVVKKGLKVQKHHLMELDSTKGFTYLLLLHYYYYAPDSQMKVKYVKPEVIDMYLSLYPTTYAKEKMKYIYTNKKMSLDYNRDTHLLTTIPAMEYIEQYLIQRQEFHEELQLLFDLPLDLCKQIIII